MICTEEIPGNTEEKVRMNVINQWDKRQNSSNSAEQVAEGVKNSANIVEPNVEND